MGSLPAFLLPLLVSAAPGADDLTLEKVLGPEVPHKYKHPAAITELDNGDLIVAYLGGAGEYQDDTAVWATRLKAGDTKWSAPKVIADTPLHGDGNPVIWQGPDRRVWLFYVVRYGNGMISGLLVIEVVLAVLGVLAIIKGVRALINSGKV